MMCIGRSYRLCKFIAIHRENEWPKRGKCDGNQSIFIKYKYMELVVNSICFCAAAAVFLVTVASIN